MCRASLAARPHDAALRLWFAMGIRFLGLKPEAIAFRRSATAPPTPFHALSFAGSKTPHLSRHIG